VTDNTPLQLRDLLKLAAFVSAHHAHIVESPEELPARALEEYWYTARNQNHSWIRCLQQRSVPADPRKSPSWKQARRVITEVFVSEVLTRVWTSILVAADRRRGVRYAEPIARSVLVGHLEARRCCLEFMVNGSDVPLHELIELDRLRRRAERWTDVLIAPMVVRYPVGEFAFDEQRARDFAQDLESRGPSHRLWALILAGVQLAFADDPQCGRATALAGGDEDVPQDQTPRHQARKADSAEPASGAGDERWSVIRSILACFPSDAFTDEGVFKSLRHLRVSRSGTVSDRRPGPDAARFAALPEVASPPAAPPLPGISFRQLRKRWPLR